MIFYKVSRACLKAFFKVTYSHETYIPEGVKYPVGAIIAANHASFLDPPLISISWPEPIHFLARKTLFKHPILRPIITNLNAHPLGGSHDSNALKLVCSLVESGNKVLVFPEGTRSSTGEISPFKQGIGMLVQRARCQIIPAYIHGSFDAWPKGRSLPKFFGVKTACVFGKPLAFDPDSDRDDCTKQIETAVLALRDFYFSRPRPII